MYRITLSISGKEFLCQKKHLSLLIELEANKVQVKYQCREGYCGVCRCRLLSGQINWITEPLAFIGDKEILPCCCQAKGNIKIEM